ncbi:DUF4233 domain-containing protein [Specibacter cremeus]|uniref:DUF4233 domain-containing protein n=1 Tax=Specibacter cremeus TaxID=1629051 RepID=UPI000F7B569D|nr:DUF4233 domain-containing protein [Specibacter cremeus]
MAKLTRAQREWQPGMPKKRRSTKVMFASTVLGLEAFVVFFAALALFGLHDKNVVFLTVGIALAVAFVVSCAFMAKKWGPALGWILQLLLITSGFLEPTMFVIGLLFAITWWYGLRAGGRIDRENVVREREQAAWEAAHPEEA